MTSATARLKKRRHRATVYAINNWKWFRRFYWRLRSWAYPGFDCQSCVGQEPWQGCYCSYHGCVAPCTGPTRRHVILRALIRSTLPTHYDESADPDTQAPASQDSGESAGLGL